MEDIEHFIKIVQAKRLVNQRELDRLDAKDEEHEKFMKKLRDLKKEREQSVENIIKHLNTITAHKHTIHKILQSKDVSGLPIPHIYTQDIKTMFVDAIDFLNNIGDTRKSFNNVNENSMDFSKLMQTIATCTETVGHELYKIKDHIMQLETLKENIAKLQHDISSSCTVQNDESNYSISTDYESTDSA